MKSKKLVAVLLVALLVVGITGSIAWAAKPAPPPSDGQSGLMSIQSTLIASGGTTFGANGRTVTVAGDTNTFYAVDYIAVKEYVQRYQNGAWVDYYYWNAKEAYNTSYVDDIHGLTVPAGYWYRGRSKHMAQDGATGETLYSYSYEIYIQ